MITEQKCIDLVRVLYRRTSTMKSTLNLDDASGSQPNESKSTIQHALPTGNVYRQLLARYLACLVYRMVTKGQPYVYRGAAYFEIKRQEK